MSPRLPDSGVRADVDAGGAAATNVFDFLRLVGATLVLLSHSFALTRGKDPFTVVTGETLGTSGVSIFFAISGFLVARSFQRSPEVVPYSVKRALRLMPALVVCTLLTALVLGPLATARPIGEYFTDGETFLYIVRNSLLYTINNGLPGVFEGNLVPGVVNGSLWTLPVEAAAYAMVGVLGLLGLLRAGVLGAIWLLLVVALAPFLGLADLGQTAADVTGGELKTAVRLIAIFAGGAFLYLVRERVPLRWDVALVATVAWFFLRHDQTVTFVAAIVVPYVTLLLAFRLPKSLNRLTAPGDVSYGLYLYAFPVQQALVAAIGEDLGPWGMFALALPITYVLALASWRLVERPALELKNRLVPAGGTDAAAKVAP